MATIIVGIGNPVLADDSVGIKIVRELRAMLAGVVGVDTGEICAGGLRLMELLQGYQKAILIDAIVTDAGRPGAIYHLRPSDLMRTRNTCSTHDASLLDALELGKKVGLSLPEDIRIWAIEAGDVTTFTENLTEAVQAAVPKVVDAVIRQVKGDINSARASGETR